MNSADNNPIEPAAAGQPRPADPVDEVLLTRYIEGRLDMIERLGVEDMLRTNAAARRRLDALREEEELIREALGSVSEPSVRLSDKVIAALHTEERVRQQALRARRVRRHVFAVLSAAAMLVLCVWLVSPRDSMGTAISGTPAALVTPNGDRRILTKDMRVFEGDRVVTAQGQFVRLRLTNWAVLDIDEHSKLRVDRSRPAPTFHLEAGRVGVRTQKQEVIIRLAQGTARISAGALVDVWLPEPADAVWPALLEPSPHERDVRGTTGVPPVADVRAAPAVVTVISGTAYVANEKLPGGIPLDSGSRALLWPQKRAVMPLDLAGSRVLNARQGSTWHALEGLSPQDRTVIGLLERPDFEDLGRRLSMTGNTSEPVMKAVSQALGLLRDAMQTAAPQDRADKLAAAQQALRLAYAPLKAHDEHRVLGRLLEGLAHLERGRALMAVLTSSPNGKAAETRNAAIAAFDAARVALEETLKPDPDAAPAQAAGLRRCAPPPLTPRRNSRNCAARWGAPSKLWPRGLAKRWCWKPAERRVARRTPARRRCATRRPKRSRKS
ncbi:MAG: hypothetical protein NTW87_22035 [Planctomycetota bacterium]|nr:hypothetical protein [Planctomycetota bacterium]